MDTFFLIFDTKRMQALYSISAYFSTFLKTELDGNAELPNHGGRRRKTMSMKKCFIFLATSVALMGSSLKAEYAAERFKSPRTGEDAIFWGDADKGKDVYVMEYDKSSGKYYLEKVEKNMPSSKASNSSVIPASAK